MNECYAYRYNAVVWLIGRTMSMLDLWACGQVHGGVHARDIVFAALEDDDGIVDYEALPQPHVYLQQSAIVSVRWYHCSQL